MFRSEVGETAAIRDNLDGAAAAHERLASSIEKAATISAPPIGTPPVSPRFAPISASMGSGAGAGGAAGAGGGGGGFFPGLVYDAYGRPRGANPSALGATGLPAILASALAPLRMASSALAAAMGGGDGSSRPPRLTPAGNNGPGYIDNGAGRNVVFPGSSSGKSLADPVTVGLLRSIDSRLARAESARGRGDGGASARREGLI